VHVPAGVPSFPKYFCVRCVARRPDGFCGVGDHAWPTGKTPTDGEAFPSRAHPTGGVGSPGPVPLPRTCRRGERLRCLPGDEVSGQATRAMTQADAGVLLYVLRR
jgi:hypothetical protein